MVGFTKEDIWSLLNNIRINQKIQNWKGDKK